VNLWTFTGKDGLPWQLFRSDRNDQGSVIARPAWPMESEKRYATPARTAPITEFPSSKDDPRNHVRLTFDVPYGERFKLGVPWLPIGFVVLSLINFMMRRQWKSVRWIGVAILVLAGLIAWEGWIGRPMLAPEQFYVSDGWWWVVLRSMYWIGWLMLGLWLIRSAGRLRRGVGSLW